MVNEELKKSGNFRKRILGAFILFALAVIFVPMFFEYVPNDLYIPKLAQAPEEPKVIALTPDDFADTAKSSSSTEIMKPAAWSLKITSTEVAPEKSVQELIRSGYPAYIQNAKDILIGPETDQKTLNRWKEELQKKNFQVDLVVYEPGK
jgi:cell division septation protein DedD